MRSMTGDAAKFARLLDRLEKFYGKPKPPYPTDPYEMILYINCAYPATETACAKSFEALKKSVGVKVDDILAASKEKLAEVTKVGGSFPEKRAARLQEIAALVKYKFAGDLRNALRKPLPEARKALKLFPCIGDPSADKILLFTKTAPIAAVPSNCVHVPLRLGLGEEKKNYAASYRSVQEAIGARLPEECSRLIRAYQLLKQHGQELCKNARPRCDLCPVSSDCLYFKRFKNPQTAA